MATAKNPITGQVGDIGAQNEAVYQQDVMGQAAREARIKAKSTQSAITPESLAPTSPVTVPTVPTSNTANSIYGQTESTLEKITADNLRKAELAATESENALKSYEKEYLNVQKSQVDIEKELQVDELSKQSNEAFTALQASQRAQQKAIKELEQNKQGLFGGALQQEIQRTNREFASEQADLSIGYDVANRNYTAAQATADRKVKLLLEPLETKIQFQTTFFNANQAKLSTAQQNAMQVLIEKNKREYDYTQKVLDTGNNIMLEAAKRNAPAGIISAISKASTIPEKIAAAGNYLATPNTQIVTAGGNSLLIDTTTGNTIRNFGSSGTPDVVTIGKDPITGDDVKGYYDPATKSFVSINNTTNPSKGVVGGFNISSYATDPQHEEKVANILSGIGQFKTVEDVDKYIKSKYPSSPITGQMIANASAETKVSWEMLVAMMEQDSSLGTKGLGARNNNPGNIGQFDRYGTNGVAGYKTLQEGVNAVGSWLAKHRATQPAPFANGQNADVTSIRSAVGTIASYLPEARAQATRRAVEAQLAAGNIEGAKQTLQSSVVSALPAEQQNKAFGRIQAIDQLQNIQSLLSDYTAKGGSTNVFTGTIESIQQKVGNTSNPELAALGNKIAMSMISYRNAVSGAAFTESEAAQYNKLFPSIGKVTALNTALIDSLITTFNQNNESVIGTVIGRDNYKTLFSPKVGTLDKNDMDQIRNIIGGTSGATTSSTFNPANFY